jgi:decaprenylphospho-beta-D-erythro-pentofuranosid-2-ulose 2-reductase
MKNAIIFGATSAIASETAKLLSAQNYNVALAARSEDKVNSVINDIQIDNNKHNLFYCNFNALDDSSHKSIISEIADKLGSIDLIIIAHGTLPSTNKLYTIDIRKSFEINAISVISICENAAEYFESICKGTIVVISSVAGDRGRQSNYIYGSAKGAVSIYLQGLRNRLFKSGVNVITIKPGFVDTPMTAHLEKNFLFASPKVIAEGIINAIENNKNVVYLPFFWKYIMLIIKSIPEFIFKRLSL